MSRVHPRTFKSLREAVKFSAGIAALFLTASFGCLHWAYSRGAFGAATVECPIRLENGSSINVHFSVPNRGDHDIEIWYPRNASDDVGKDVRQIFGAATLRIGDAPVAQFPLPVDHGRSYRDGSAMVLFSGPMNPRNDYILVLRVDSIPSDLAGSQAIVRVPLVADYHLLFLELEGTGVLMLLAGVFCAFLSVRWWRSVSVLAIKQG